MQADESGNNSASQRLSSFMELVPYPLDLSKNLDRPVKKFCKDVEARALAGSKLKIQILSSFTTNYLADYLLLMLARRGFDASIHTAEYGSIATSILDLKHEIYETSPDVFLILPTFRDLMHSPQFGAPPPSLKTCLESEVSFWSKLWHQLPAPVVQLSFSFSDSRPLGDLDALIPGGTTFHARNVNVGLNEVSPSSVAIVDSEHLACRVGLRNWHDPQVYALCKQPFSMEALPEIADTLAASIQGVLGRARKVLVLDLDNTLWGGVIGDDGLDGIQLGPETPEGEAFTRFQKYVEGLRQKGVILTVCSKNQYEIAKEAFCRHPSMLLQFDDIVNFVANFEDKPSNLIRMSKELNLGLDSFVFVDDSPIERELMRDQLPEVLTVEMPENPAFYVEALESCKLFSSPNITKDDLLRTASYKLRSQVNKDFVEATDIDNFLKSLEPKAIIEGFGPSTRDRIVQLIAKTNQFKLNPIQFTEKELENSNREVISIRFQDRLQDYGIVAVAVLKLDDDKVLIENWVMSCRVFSRRLEFYTFELIKDYANSQSAKSIELEYIPSKKNGVILDLLSKLSFEQANERSNVFRLHFKSPCGLPRLPDHYIALHLNTQC